MTGCGVEPADRERVVSAIRSAQSYAAETVLMADLVLQRRVPPRYAQEHATYVAKALEQSKNDLERLQARPETVNLVRACQEAYSAISGELSQIRAAIAVDDNSRLAAARARLDQIRVRLDLLASQ